MEFQIHGDFQVPRPRAGVPVDCSRLREVWKECVVKLVSQVKGERRVRRIASMLKSCNRLFDIACLNCDPKLASEARSEWRSRVGTHVEDSVSTATSWSADPILSLVTAVRELVGTEWASKRERKADEYVPDQQGCLENKRLTGGTFGVLPSEEVQDHGLVRVGVAKTKGKFRVVTMQSSRTKRILAPVHNSLYNHITSFGWCVRGDVTKGDFETLVADKLEGEVYVSGDYKSATDNIYLPAVQAIVNVLCDAEHLTLEERTALRESFEDIRYVTRSGIQYPVLRGSMMGNLVSFPLLCLLNKACFDIASDTFRGRSRSKGSRDRKVRVNGDDIAFCGSDAFFLHWKEVVSHYGLVINVEKTELSPRFIELNSRSYDSFVHRFVAKPCLGFLRKTNGTDDLLSGIIKDVSTLLPSVALYVLNVSCRYEISLRSISPANIPENLWRKLVKRRWFRNCLSLGPAPEKSKGVRRSLPVTVGVPPRARFYEFVTQKAQEMTSEMVSQFRGLKVLPEERTVDRRQARARARLSGSITHVCSYLRSAVSWSFVWPRDLFTFFSDRYPRALLTSFEDEWLEDHPFLSTKVSVLRIPRPFSRPSEGFPTPNLLLDNVVVNGFVRFPNGFV